MIQMRWYATVNRPEPRLQYRQWQNTTSYAGMPTEKFKLETGTYGWSDWMGVPMVKEG